MTPTTQPSLHEIKMALSGVLLEPLCPVDRLTIVRRIECNRDKTKPIRKLHKKYRFPDIVTAAIQLVCQAHKTPRKRSTKAVLQSPQRLALNVPHPVVTPLRSENKDNRNKRAQGAKRDASRDSQSVEDTTFAVQHKVLVKLQALLERVCFSFTRQRMPGLLVSKGWTCAEAIELNVWLRCSQEQPSFLAALDTVEPGARRSMIATLVQVRHATVHRECQVTDWMREVMQAAILFGQRFGDTQHQLELVQLARLSELMIKNLMRRDMEQIVVQDEPIKCARKPDRERERHTHTMVHRSMTEALPSVPRPRIEHVRCRNISLSLIMTMLRKISLTYGCHICCGLTLMISWALGRRLYNHLVHSASYSELQL